MLLVAVASRDTRFGSHTAILLVFLAIARAGQLLNMLLGWMTTLDEISWETAARGQGTKPTKDCTTVQTVVLFSPHRVHDSKRNLYQCPNKFISVRSLSPATLHCNKIQNRLRNRSTCSKIPWCREPQQRGKCSAKICTGLYICGEDAEAACIKSTAET